MIEIFKTNEYKKAVKSYDALDSVRYYIDSSYQWNDKNSTFLIGSTPEEVKEAVKLKPATKQIKPGSKIYFSPNSWLSPLYLSKLNAYNIGIKRVLKPEKADIIVCGYQDPNTDHKYWTTKYIGDSIRLHSGRYWAEWSTLQTDASIVNKKLNVPVYFGYKMSFAEATQCMLMVTYPDKIVYDADLMHYLYSYLPEISEDRYNTVIEMITNPNTDVRLAGIACLQYYNISNKIVDLYLRIYESGHLLSTLSELTQACYNLCVIFNVPRSWWISYRWKDPARYSRDIATFVNNNDFITESMDSVAQKIVNKYLKTIEEDYSYRGVKEALETLGYTIKLEKLPDDQNGETESGN